MRRLFSFFACLGLSIFFIGFLLPREADALKASESSAHITIETARGTVSVPSHPSRIAVYDWAALDTLTALGVPVPATTAAVHVDYLQGAFAQAKSVGTLFEPDYEALDAYQPELIITGGPGASAYDGLQKIAPTIDMTIDNQHIRATGIARIDAFAKLFQKEAEGEKLKNQINQVFAEARQAAVGKGNALVISIYRQ